MKPNHQNMMKKQNYWQIFKNRRTKLLMKIPKKNKRDNKMKIKME